MCMVHTLVGEMAGSAVANNGGLDPSLESCFSSLGSAVGGGGGRVNTDFTGDALATSVANSISWPTKTVMHFQFGWCLQGLSPFPFHTPG